jgi:hypothetical protein
MLWLFEQQFQNKNQARPHCQDYATSNAYKYGLPLRFGPHSRKLNKDRCDCSGGTGKRRSPSATRYVCRLGHWLAKFSRGSDK